MRRNTEKIKEKKSNLKTKKNTENKNILKEKNTLNIIILTISIILLLIVIVSFIYLKKLNDKETNKIQNLTQNIKVINDNILSSNIEKDKQESEYKRLQGDYQEQLEELSIWEELEKKLVSSLQ